MGHKLQEVDPVLPLRPPACLALLDNVKDGEERKTVLEDLRAEASQVQSRLKDQLKQFRIEVDIFSRLMYKNKNQHRHSLYYRRMLQVRRDLRLLDYSALDKTVEGFTRWTFSFKESRANVDQRSLGKDQEPESRKAKSRLRAIPFESSLSPLPSRLECHWDGGKLCITEIEPPPEVRRRAEVAEAGLLAIPSSGLWFVDDRKSLSVTNRTATTATVPPIIGAKFLRAGDLRLADVSTGVKYDVRVSAVTAREDPRRVPETAQSHSSSMQLESEGAASITHMSLDEPPAEVSVIGESSDGVKDLGTHLKDEEKSTALVDIADFVTNLSESNASLTSAEEKPPEEVADVLTETRVLATEDQFKPADAIGATSRGTYTSGVSSVNTEHRPMDLDRREDDGSVSTGVPLGPQLRHLAHPDSDFLSTRHEKENQKFAVDEGDVLMLNRFVHDASTTGNVGDENISSYACEDATRRTTQQEGPKSCSDQVLPSKEEKDGIVSNGTVVESSVECRRKKKDVSSQSLTGQVTKRAVAYISILPPPESYVQRERQKDDTEKVQVIELGGGAVDKLGHTRAENGFLESSRSAHGQVVDENTSHQGSEGIPGHSIVSPGERSETEGGLCVPASVPDITSAVDGDKQSILIGPVEASLLGDADGVEEQRKIPFQSILTLTASEDRECEVVTDITLVERRKEIEAVSVPNLGAKRRAAKTSGSERPRKKEIDAVSVPKLGAKRRAGKTSGSERPRKRVETSKHEVAASDRKLGNATEGDGKTRKKKPRRKKQPESKPESLHRQVNEKVSKKNHVNDLFNMLLGGS